MKTIVFILMAILFVAQPSSASSRDTWYYDVSRSHWAYKELQTMWEEYNLDGWIFRDLWTNRDFSYYRPNNQITRAEYAVLIAKTFDLSPIRPDIPTYTDVPKNYQVYNRGKEGYPWIETATAAGIITGVSNTLFRPDNYLRRDHGIIMLVRALELEGYVNNLTETEIENTLRAFRDHNKVDPSIRAEFAAAIKLGIIQGYPDRTLRPDNYLNRAEAAVILYRSALFVPKATPITFSPDGDGYQDTTTFTFRTLKNTNISSWYFEIVDARGVLVKRFSGTNGTAGYPPSEIIWDGKDNNGYTVLPGTYFYSGWIRDRNNTIYSSVTKPLYVEERRLSAGVSPTIVPLGDKTTIWAETKGDAYHVEVSILDQTHSLNKKSRWETEIDTNLIGPQQAIITAHYSPGITQTVSLTYWVEERIWLYAYLDKTSALAGGTLILTAQTSPNVEHVEVHWEYGKEDLIQISQELWQKELKLPLDMEAKDHILTVIAYGKQKQEAIDLLFTLKDFFEIPLFFHLIN